MRVLKVQKTGSWLAARTLPRQGLKSPASKGVRNPSVPILKLMTGGKGVSSTKREVRCSTVPSPPRDMQKSTSAMLQQVGKQKQMRGLLIRPGRSK